MCKQIYAHVCRVGHSCRSCSKSSSGVQLVELTSSAGAAARCSTAPDRSHSVQGVAPSRHGESAGSDSRDNEGAPGRGLSRAAASVESRLFVPDAPSRVGAASGQMGSPLESRKNGRKRRKSVCRSDTGNSAKNAGGRSYKTRASTAHSLCSHVRIASVTQRWLLNVCPKKRSNAQYKRTMGCRKPKPPCASTLYPRLCQSATM
eukprot:804291-Pleurochrysis_carterae.AAC.3